MASDIGQNETETDSIIILDERKADDEISIDSFKRLKGIPPSRQASSVWNYFEKIFDDNSTLINVRCIHCGQKYSPKCSTTTLNDHLKKKHSGEDTKSQQSQQSPQIQ